MNESEYARLPGIRSSHLRLMLTSCPAAFQWAVNNDADESSEAQRLGTAVHALTLQTATVELKQDGRTTEGKRHNAECEARAHIMLGRDDYQHAAGMWAVVDPLLSSLGVKVNLCTHVIERPIQWQDADTGMICKCRPDVIGMRNGLLLDIKTARNAKLPAFAHASYQYGYHQQMAYYRMGAASQGVIVTNVVLLVVESKPPYLTVAYPMSEAALSRGEADMRRALQLVAECKRTNQWPGLPDGAIDLPAWASERNDMITEEDLA